MVNDAKFGKEILSLVVQHFSSGQYYTLKEFFRLLCDKSCFVASDLEESESGEAKAYRRPNNALRDVAVTEIIQNNEESKPFQYRVSP